ncbi:MAG: nitroreductase family protein [Actinobacteria bacterium]|nr:nitroreductase family protein [Actinomycetota bacterium]
MTASPRPAASPAPVGPGHEQALLAAINLARLAPSLHNTQPWRWRVSGPVAELHSDPDRAVPIADPWGREMLLGCGATLQHARSVLAAAGWRVAVSRLPDPTEPDLVARLELVEPASPAAEEARLAEAIPHRHTDRRPYTARRLPADVLQTLQQAAEQEHAHLLLVTEPDDRLDLAALTDLANRIQIADEDYTAELVTWSGERTDSAGIPAGLVPHLEAPRHTDVPVRDFEVSRPGQLPVTGTVDEEPAWCVLFTDSDTRLDHLRAGEAMARLLLTATDLGVASCPQSQAVEVPGARVLLEARLLAGLGHAQLVLRLGWPDPDGEPLPRSPRRALSEIVQVDKDPA